MNRASGAKDLQPHEVTGKLVNPTPRKIDLHNAYAIRRELATVYRDMRSCVIDPQDGTKFAYVLDMIRKSYETCVLEDRLTELERTLKPKGDNND